MGLYKKKKTTKSHAGGSHSPHEVCCQMELLLLWAFYQVYSHQVTSAFSNFRTIGWVKNNSPSALYTHTYCKKKKKRKVIALSTMWEKIKERECIWSSGVVSLGTNLCVTPGCSFCFVILLQAVGYWLLHYKEQLEECWLAQGSKSSWFLLCAWIYGCKLLQVENIACREREAGGDTKAHTEICWRDPSNAERYNRRVIVTEEKEGSGKRCTPVITLYFFKNSSLLPFMVNIPANLKPTTIRKTNQNQPKASPPPTKRLQNNKKSGNVTEK